MKTDRYKRDLDMITLKRICGNTIRNNEECNFNSEFSNIVLIKINLYKSYYVFPLLVLVFSLINILTFEQVVILLFSIRQSHGLLVSSAIKDVLFPPILNALVFRTQFAIE